MANAYLSSLTFIWLWCMTRVFDEKYTALLQFDSMRELLQGHCYSKEAKRMAAAVFPVADADAMWPVLNECREIHDILGAGGFFPSVEFDSVDGSIHYLLVDGTSLPATKLLELAKTIEGCNSLIRYIKNNKNNLPYLYAAGQGTEVNQYVIDCITAVISEEAEVKSNASPDLLQIRKKISEKRRESDKRFYAMVGELRKQEILRENEESFFNGRRTLAVMAEFKSEVNGLVHGKSESGRTIFIEPHVCLGINNEIAELEIDENREINRILRQVCSDIKPYAALLKKSQHFLHYIDFTAAKAKLAKDLDACLPTINTRGELQVNEAYHPLLFLQNKKNQKKIVPLDLHLNQEQRMVVISGPNAGGKTVALKTIGLLQIMLQSGLLIPVKPTSSFGFFDYLLIDIGDTQSIENELSTYSAKLKSMTHILQQANASCLILMDEFGSGTDPDLGSAIAETVLETLAGNQAKAIITTHFGKVKLLADKLPGCVNASMLFDSKNLEPYYKLMIGEPGSSFTFEVAERIGFPLALINKAKEKIDKNELQLSRLLSTLQEQKLKLEWQQQQLEHETFVMKMGKEKYHNLFQTWEEKIQKDREKKLELQHLAEFGQKYLRLMEDWNEKKDRKVVIKRFIDGITAETKKQEELKKRDQKTNFAAKKIERIKPKLKVGSKVRVLNGQEIGVVESIKDDKVQILMGLMKMQVGMENLVLAE